MCAAEQCIDIDGNVYKTVKLGSQLWMVENLKVTRYRNGDEIPEVTGDSKWENLKTGARCVYDNKKAMLKHTVIFTTGMQPLTKETSLLKAGVCRQMMTGKRLKWHWA